MRPAARAFVSRAWAAAALAVVSGLAAEPGAAAEPLRDDRGVVIHRPAPPQRIVSLLPSLTETVCALGACARLVGTDQWSNWPASVQALPKLGGLEDVQIERIAVLKPDLVLAARSARAAERLEALGVPVAALQSDSLADQRRSTLLIARLLGQPEAGPALLQRLDQRLAAAAARVPPGWRGARVYFEVSSAPHAAGAASFIGETLAGVGLGNIVPATLGAFPQLNPEFVVRAQPDVVIASKAEQAAMRRRPGWAGLVAFEQGRQCLFERATMDLLVRPGPRLVEGAEAVAECLAGLPPPLPRR